MTEELNETTDLGDAFVETLGRGSQSLEPTGGFAKAMGLSDED